MLDGSVCHLDSLTKLVQVDEGGSPVGQHQVQQRAADGWRAAGVITGSCGCLKVGQRLLVVACG